MTKLIPAVARFAPKLGVGRAALRDLVAPVLAGVSGLIGSLVQSVLCGRQAVIQFFNPFRLAIASPGTGIGIITPLVGSVGRVPVSKRAARELRREGLDVEGARRGEISNRSTGGTIALVSRPPWAAKFPSDALEATGKLAADSPAPDLLAALVLRDSGP